MKISLQKILLCTSLALSTIVGITLTPATSVEAAAGDTYVELYYGGAYPLPRDDLRFEVVSGFSVVEIRPTLKVVTKGYGNAVIYGYKNGVHIWTWHIKVI
ncbi:hypothetical protein [Paenibacillus sp. NAIST15-1]|uniref:hypothetical protein n=1 Tax=Paenibacillus sp. NAIST15-1 TaxID=1605994 RepID=UPI00086848C8|nr:hypothetical protein [Paenibacillus sp. NAIST15-1]GAV11399.1 hypothetical protein PBN151_1328 [Paenibacillus sp. NAIST15-1]